MEGYRAKATASRSSAFPLTMMGTMITATEALLLVWKGKEIHWISARIYKGNNESGSSRRNEAETNSGTSFFFFKHINKKRPLLMGCRE